MIALIDTKRLTPYVRNHKHHPQSQLDKLKSAIIEFGFCDPVIYAGNSIVSGHGRLLAAQQLWDADVDLFLPPNKAGERVKLDKGVLPCIDASGWSEAQIKAARIAFNRLGDTELAPYDMEMLQVELDDLKVFDFDVELTGFDASFESGEDTEDKDAPDDFCEVDENIETNHTCPKCGYSWS